MRSLLTATFAAAALLSSTSAALAAPASTVTVTNQGISDAFFTLSPCPGPTPLVYITTVENNVFHITALPNGTLHFTFTATGTLTVQPVINTFTIDPVTGEPSVTPSTPIPAPGAPVFSGHFAVWSGANANSQSFSGTFTLNVKVTGSDGSVVKFNLVSHVNVTPTSATMEITKVNCH